MKNSIMAAVFALGWLGCASGDNQQDCTASLDSGSRTAAYVAPRLPSFDSPYPRHECGHSIHILTEESRDILISDEAVARYQRRLMLAFEAEPLLKYLAGTRSFALDHTTLLTDRAEIYTAWSRGQFGDITPAARSALTSRDTKITQVIYPRSNPRHSAYIQSRGYFNAARLNAELQKSGVEFYPIDPEQIQPEIRGMRTHFTWPAGIASDGEDGETAQIDADLLIRLNVEPYFSRRKLRAIVSETEAIVYDMGGDPIPPEAGALQPTTLPWPGP